MTVKCIDHPYQVKCPEYPLLRRSYGKLSAEEEDYVKQKGPFTSNKFHEYLRSPGHNYTLFDTIILENIMQSPPIIGLAISGGGYRSMLTATGMIQEMDSMGLFDPLTYITGLSGGSWVLLDLILHGYNPSDLLEFWDLETGILEGIPNFDIQSEDITGDISPKLNQTFLLKRQIDNTTLENSSLATSNFQRGLFEKRGGFPFVRNLKNKIKPGLPIKKPSTSTKDSNLLPKISEFYLNIHFKVRQKKLAGFHLCFTDYWGRALLQRATEKYHALHTTSLYNLINRNERFISKKAPIPIFIANCRNKGMKNFVFEFTPFEFGSWERNAQIFAKLEYLGSYIKNGINEKCYRQFDDIGFITATSSSIFNNVVAFVWTKLYQTSPTIVSIFSHLVKIFGVDDSKEVLDVNNQYSENNKTIMKTDYAIYHPNPFYQYTKANITDSITRENYLYLVDGGEDGENIPLRNLMVPARNVETIFIIDSSSDIHNYPNGTKLVNVLDRLKLEGIDYVRNGNYSSILLSKIRPLVLGCFMKPTNLSEKLPPVLIYYQNHKVSFPSNMSTFKATYSREEKEGMLGNGREIFHGRNLETSVTLEKCLPCFILKRRLDSIFTTKEYPYSYEFCHKCFKTFCFS